jgi:hypothetical protein
MSLSLNQLSLFASMISLFFVRSLFAQETIDNWTIVPGSDGRSVTMTYANPATFLKIESNLEVSVDATGLAVSGVVHFNNGVSRAMTSGELPYYVMEYGGDNAYWDFRQKQGSVSTYDFGAGDIPRNFVGRQVRVLSKAGKQYIGILSMLPASPDWFSLSIRGNAMMFYKNAVKQIQELQ